jgi:hypothetical protein
VTVAKALSLLTHVPPVVGDKVVVAPTHMAFAPVILTTGFAFTVTADVAKDAQPVLVWVNVKVGAPLDTPDTTPALVTVAKAVLLLVHVPPVVGDKVVVAPTHMGFTPVMLTTGFAFTVIADVAKDAHPVLVWVNVKVGAPLVTPDTTPALVTVAKAVLLLAHVPPVVGNKVVVAPTHMGFTPVILTTGFAFTVTADVAKDAHPVLVWVNVKVGTPLITPDTTPALVTVAKAVLLLVHVPPVVGDKVVVAPMHMAFAPVILTTGFAFTVTADVAKDAHPVLVWVNVKVGAPLDTPDTTPALVTVAKAVLLLDHVPPVVGDKVVVAPTHMGFAPVMLTTGFAFTVTADVAKDVHPVLVWVNVKVGAPLDTPDTTPALVTVAKAVLLLAHVPPVVGDKVVVAPTHMAFAPVILTTGFAFTVTADVAKDAHPVLVWVNVKVGAPLDTPDTIPALVTVAKAVLLLAHVPPVVGDKVVVAPTHMGFAPVMLTTGFALTVTADVAKDVHPVLVWVNVKVGAPLDTPDTTPALVTVAKALSLLAHVPPVVGDKVVVAPTHIAFAPVILTTGFAFTVTADVAKDAHPVLVSVNVNVGAPLDTPDTTPALVTVAKAVLLLAHVPPVVGDKVVVAPTHMGFTPVMPTTGFAFTVTADVAKDAHPVLVWVNVNVGAPLDTPDTTPALVTVAKAVLLLAHVPPVVGDKVVVAPTHMAFAPVMLTVGRASMLTVTDPVLFLPAASLTTT